MKHKLMTRPDIVVIAVCLLCALVLLVLPILRSGGRTAVVSVNGESVAELPLHTDTTQTIRTEYGVNTVVVQNGACFVSAADCRDGICISRGRISKAGESIVCLPHKLIVEIA